MSEYSPAESLGNLSTPHLADACLRVGVPVRCAPAGLTAVTRGVRCAGRALPARHYGSVDIFFEALEGSNVGDILVVDNGGRLDEACVGDLVTLEVLKAGLAGMVVWGLHRDTDELIQIGLPVFSLGTMPTGPQGLEPRCSDSLECARVGPLVITANDYVVGDSDGLIFLPATKLHEVVTAAGKIRETERKHAEKMNSGVTFRQQTRFARYLESRKSEPTLGFREHLRRLGASIEE